MSDTDTETIFDTPPDEQAEARHDAEAEADVTAGRVVPHERVREWLQRLIRGEKTPPPIT
jgi:predicted transcriptional regulator